jgi:hypothetical protein
VLLAAQPKTSKWNGRNVGRVVMATLVAIVFLGNLFPWAVEFYVRHVSKREFYDVARRSAYAQLVDIGAYAQQHVPPGQTIWMNAGAHRRIAYFLSGRRIDTSELALGDWKDWNRLVEEYRAGNPTSAPTTRPATGSATTTRPATTQAATQPLVAKRRMSAALRRKLFFNGIAKQGRYLIVFVSHPRGKGENWPGWHLPMLPDDPQVEWWRLYEKQPDDTWKAVNVPRNRDYVRGVPPAGE